MTDPHGRHRRCRQHFTALSSPRLWVAVFLYDHVPRPRPARRHDITWQKCRGERRWIPASPSWRCGKVEASPSPGSLEQMGWLLGCCFDFEMFLHGLSSGWMLLMLTLWWGSASPPLCSGWLAPCSRWVSSCMFKDMLTPPVAEHHTVLEFNNTLGIHAKLG